MDTPFEDIAFLANSPNRVGVLETLAEGPRDRHDLQAELDISQPTASRIRRGAEYELTRVGELTITAFTGLREQLAAVHHLSGVASMLPEDGFDFDLARLRTADVVRIAEGDSGLARTHENAQLASADRVRILTAFAPRESVKTTWRQVTEGNQRFELVLEAGTIQAIRADPDKARWVRETLASDRAEVYRFQGSVDYPLLITDETVHLALPRNDEADGAWISSDDEAVLAWATARFERHRDHSERLTEDDVSP